MGDILSKLIQVDKLIDGLNDCEDLQKYDTTYLEEIISLIDWLASPSKFITFENKIRRELKSRLNEEHKKY